MESKIQKPIQSKSDARHGRGCGTPLKRVTEWSRQNCHRRIREQVQLLNAKLRGYKNYYGVSGNSASLDEFFYHVRRIHQRWLNQRSQRLRYTWAADNELIGLLRLEQPRIAPAAKRSL